MFKSSNSSKWALYISITGLISSFLSALIYGTWQLAAFEKRLSLEERNTILITEKMNIQNIQLERINQFAIDSNNKLQEQINRKLERMEDKMEKIYVLLSQTQQKREI